MKPPVVVSLEFTVSDMDQALLFFVDVMGFDLGFRSRHPTLDAEIAVVGGEPIRINLVCATDTGTGIPMDNPESRMSQIDLECASNVDATELKVRLIESGAAVVERSGLFFLDTGMTQHLLGTEAAFVFYPAGADEEVGAPASSDRGVPRDP